MASVIAAARSELFDLLDASAGVLANVQVTFGAPEALEEAECVSLGGVEDAREDPISLGAQTAEESFFILVECKSYDPAGSPADVDARGWALAEGVREVVRDNRTLNGIVRWAQIRSQTSDGVQPAISETERLPGFVIFVTVRVECGQRIS